MHGVLTLAQRNSSAAHPTRVHPVHFDHFSIIYPEDCAVIHQQAKLVFACIFYPEYCMVINADPRSVRGDSRNPSAVIESLMRHIQR